jgi:hypothetical protein
LADKIGRFHNGHDRVKNAVHSYWRQNTILSPRGRFGKVVMSGVYFSLPVVAGYFVVTAVVDQSESTVPDRFGDHTTKHEPTLQSSTDLVGAGGWGGGVNLATSDKQTHDVNKINLERFMKKQRRLKQKREREAAATAAAATAAQQ